MIATTSMLNASNNSTTSTFYDEDTTNYTITETMYDKMQAEMEAEVEELDIPEPMKKQEMKLSAVKPILRYIPSVMYHRKGCRNDSLIGSKNYKRIK